MSDTDSEEIPHTSWLDSESDFPERSSVNSAINPWVNVISPSANLTHEQALGVEDRYLMCKDLCIVVRLWIWIILKWTTYKNQNYNSVIIINIIITKEKFKSAK